MTRITEMGYQELRSYLESRLKIDPEVKSIYSLAPMLGQMEDFERDRLQVDPVALGLVHLNLEQSILAIWGALDDFLRTQTAEQLLKERIHSTPK